MWILDCIGRVQSASLSVYKQIQKNVSRSSRYGFLLFCVLSSKNILIYNEEFLVALTFVLFLDFSFYYFSGTVKESLDERSSSIQLELQGVCQQKREIYQYNVNEYENTHRACSMVSKCKDFTSSILGLRAKAGERAQIIDNAWHSLQDSILFSESREFVYSKVRHDIRLCSGVYNRSRSKQTNTHTESLITSLGSHFKRCALLGKQSSSRSWATKIKPQNTNQVKQFVGENANSQILSMGILSGRNLSTLLSTKQLVAGLSTVSSNQAEIEESASSGKGVQKHTSTPKQGNTTLLVGKRKRRSALERKQKKGSNLRDLHTKSRTNEKLSLTALHENENTSPENLTSRRQNNKSSSPLNKKKVETDSQVTRNSKERASGSLQNDSTIVQSSQKRKSRKGK